MTTTPPRTDPRLGAAALRAPAASKEDSRPQAILKFQPRNGCDNRIRYESQLAVSTIMGPEFFQSKILPLLGPHKLCV